MVGDTQKAQTFSAKGKIALSIKVHSFITNSGTYIICTTVGYKMSGHCLREQI